MEKIIYETYINDLDSHLSIDVATTNFAMEILMPEKAFRSSIIPGQTTVKQLSDRFGVPHSVVKKRCKQLGYKIKAL